MYFGVLGFALLLYTISCAPGALWQDSGMVQYRVWHNDIEGGLGLALSHPLFYIIAIAAKYIPLSEILYRINLVSAISSAFAVANLFLFLRLWLGASFPAIIGAITFALSHTFWRHSSIIESYTLYMMLFTAELILLLQYVRSNRVKYLYWLGFVNGLSISVHMLGTLALLCYGVFFVYLLIKKKMLVKHFSIIVLVWILGALPYEFLIIKNIIETGDCFGVLKSALFGGSWQGAVLNTSLSFRIVKENILFILLNFPTPNILLFFVGFPVLFKFSEDKSVRRILAALTLLFFGFAFRYTIPDRYAFFIPFYCMVSLFTGYGAYFLQSRINKKSTAYLILLFSLFPLFAYSILPSAAEARKINLGIRRTIPYRQDYSFFLQPWKTGYHGAEKFGREALDLVEKDAVIYADGTTVYALLLVQEIENRREDVTIVSGHGTVNNLSEYGKDVIDKIIAERPVYVVFPIKGYCPDFLLQRYDFIKTKILYKVVKTR